MFSVRMAYNNRWALYASREILLKQIKMQLLHHLLGIFAGHQEAQVMAGCAVTNHANVERFQYAEYLFALI